MASNYEKLVKALRCCISKNPPETCVGCTYSKCNNECAVRRMILDAAAAIEELLPKRGEWVGVSPTVDTVQCSICGGQIFSAELETPYCPYCGAKMIGEQNVE